MPITRMNCCEDGEDTLIVDTHLAERVYLEHDISIIEYPTSIALDLQSVNTLIETLTKWKEESNYD